VVTERGGRQPRKEVAPVQQRGKKERQKLNRTIPNERTAGATKGLDALIRLDTTRGKKGEETEGGRGRKTSSISHTEHDRKLEKNRDFHLFAQRRKERGGPKREGWAPKDERCGIAAKMGTVLSIGRGGEGFMGLRVFRKLK